MAKCSDSLAKKLCPSLKCELDDPEQSAKFIEFAETIETEDTEEQFARVVKRVASYKPNRRAKMKAKSQPK